MKEGDQLEEKVHQTEHSSRKRNRKKTVSLIFGAMIILTLIVCVGISIFVGYSMTHPEKKTIEQSPSDYGMAYEDIEFSSRGDGLQLSGWVLKPEETPKMTVIFSHGYKGNRYEDHIPYLSMAKDLLDKGYRVVMFDFRYAGESDGDMSTIGAKEQFDLLGAIDYVNERYDEPIGLLGISMGASTSLLAASQAEDVIGVVADSPFSDLEEYLKVNLPVWSNLPNFPFTPLILTLVPMISDLDPKNASPISVLGDIAPRRVLFIHNKEDDAIPYTESKKMAEKNPEKFKLWLPDGEGHVKAYKQNKDEYIKKVDTFFEASLEEAS